MGSGDPFFTSLFANENYTLTKTTQIKQLNLTQGAILPSLTRLAAPIMATAFLSTAYTLTDAFWVGLLGSRAVAGVGTGGMYIWLSGGLVQLARVGGQVYTGHAIGAGEKNRAEKFAAASLGLALFIGIIFGHICFFFASPLISVFHLNDPLSFQYAVDYLKVTGGLVVFSFLTLTLTGLMTAEADSKTPFVCNVIGLIVNMILDPVLILGLWFFPRLEAFGAAVATVMAQLCVLLAMLFFIFRIKKESVLKNIFKTRAGSSEYKKILRLSLPSSLQSMTYCAISMVLARLIAPFGDVAIGVQRIGGQIEALSWNVADGFAAALNAFTAQNYGAGQKERYVRGYYISSGILFAWGIFIAVVFLIFAYPVSELFFHEADIIGISVGYLRVISVCEPFMCIEILTSSALSALEKTKLSSFISITLTASRIPLVLILLTAGVGVSSFWWTLTITSTLKGIVFFAVYTFINKRAMP